MRKFILFNLILIQCFIINAQSSDWTVIGSPLTNSLELLFASSSGVLIARNTEVYEMYYSLDNGVTWEHNSQKIYNQQMFLEDKSGNIVFTSNREIFRFNITTKEIEIPFQSETNYTNNRFLGKTPNGDIIFNDSNRLLVVSEDWTIKNISNNAERDIVAIDYYENGLIAGYVYKNINDFYYKENMVFGQNPKIKLTEYGSVFASQGSRLYAGVHYSDDRGSTWKKLNLQGDNLLSIQVVDQNKAYFIYPDAIYFTQDKGQSFTSVSVTQNISNAWLYQNGKFTIQSYRVPNYESFNSENHGQMWQKINFSAAVVPYCNEVVAGENGNLFITFNGLGTDKIKYFKATTTSQWNQWNLNNLGNQFTIITDYGSSVFAHAQKHGLFESKDKGFTWEKKAQFDPNNYIGGIQIKKDFAATTGGSKSYISLDSFQTWDSINFFWGSLATPCFTNDFDLFGVGFGSENLVVQNLNPLYALEN